MQAEELGGEWRGGEEGLGRCCDRTGPDHRMDETETSGSGCWRGSAADWAWKSSIRPAKSVGPPLVVFRNLCRGPDDELARGLGAGRGGGGRKIVRKDRSDAGASRPRPEARLSAAGSVGEERIARAGWPGRLRLDSVPLFSTHLSHLLHLQNNYPHQQQSDTVLCAWRCT